MLVNKMEDYSENIKLKNKQKYVTVKEISADDPTVEAIKISDPLLEILVKDPVFGRSDYSDLPGVKTNVHSLWRSFAEYPRRSDQVAASVVHRHNNSNSIEERRRKNDQARMRREKLVIQRAEKRERLKFQQRERKRQKALFDKLQNQSPENGENISAVIISSPKKTSPVKIWKEKKKNVVIKDKKMSDSISESCKINPCSKKSVTGLGNIGITDFKVDQNIRDIIEEVVSTTFSHQMGELVHGSDDKLTVSESATTSCSSHGKQLNESLFEEHEDNPVSSSSQDETNKTLSSPLLKSANCDRSKSSGNASWAVTSTTDPEIVAADSSTPNTLERKKRNIKRVNYTEMLEEDFDQEMYQRNVRESKTGRKIIPVKRTLEKAIVDASLKKSPRKRKKSVDEKNEKSSLQTPSDLSGSTDNDEDELKLSKKPIKAAVTPAKEKQKKAKHLSTGLEPQQLIPYSQPTEPPTHSTPSDCADSFQQWLLLASVPPSNTPSLQPFSNNGPTVRQLNPQNSDLCSLPKVIPTSQSDFLSLNQQPYSNSHPPSTLHNHAQHLPPTVLQNPLHSVTSPSHQQPVTNFLVSSRPQGSFPTPQFALQPPVPLPIPSCPRPLVYNMNNLKESPLNFLLSPQTSEPPSTVRFDLGSQQTTIQEPFIKKGEHLCSDNVGLKTSVSAKNVPAFNINLSTTVISNHNTNNSPKSSAQQLQIFPNSGFNVISQAGLHNLPQHNLATSKQSVAKASSSLLGYSSSVVKSSNLSTSTKETINTRNPEVPLPQKESQLYVDRVLNHTISKHSFKNTTNSNKESQRKKLKSSNCKSSQNQKGTESRSTLEPAQRLSTKSSQSVQKPMRQIQKHLEAISQGQGLGTSFLNPPPSNKGHQSPSQLPPPPLQLSISDSSHFPLNTRMQSSGFSSNISIAHQSTRSLPTNQNSSHAASIANLLQPFSVSSQVTPTIEKYSTQLLGQKQRHLLVKQPGNVFQYNMGNPLLQTAHAQNRPLAPSSNTNQVKHQQDSSTAKQDQLSKLLQDTQKYSVPGNEMTHYQRPRLPAPKFVECSRLNQQAKNLARKTPPRVGVPALRVGVSAARAGVPASRVGVPPKVIDQQAFTLQQRHWHDAFGAYRMSSAAYRPSNTSVATTALPANTQKPVAGPAQVLTHLLTASSSNSSHNFPTRPQAPQYSSAMDILNRNQLSTSSTTETVRLFQPQSNQQQILTNAGLFMPQALCLKNMTNSQTPNSSSVTQNPSTVKESLQNAKHNFLPSPPFRQGQVTSALRKTLEVQSQSIKTYNSGHSSHMPTVTMLGTLPVADIKPFGSSLLHALDLSHKSLSDSQNHQLMAVATAVSVPNTATQSSNVLSSQNTPITSKISKISYDYPLTKAQIKQEFLSQSEQSGSYNNVSLHQNWQNNEATEEGTILLSTKFNQSNSTTAYPETSLALGELTNSATPAQIIASEACQSLLRDKPTKILTEAINIKMEINASQGTSTQPLSCSLTIATTQSCQTSLLVSQATKASQISSHSTSVTTSRLTPIISSLSSNFKHMQSSQSASAPRAVVSILSDKDNCSSSEKRTIVETLPPAHVVIKKETYPDMAIVKETEPSHHTDLHSASSSSDIAQAQFHKTFSLEKNASYLPEFNPNGQLVTAPRGISPLQQNIQHPTNLDHSSIEDNRSVDKLPVNTGTLNNTPDCQSFIYQIHPVNSLLHLNSSQHVTSTAPVDLNKRGAQPNNLRTIVGEIIDNTFQSSTNSMTSSEYQPMIVAQGMKPVFTSSMTPMKTNTTVLEQTFISCQECRFSQDNDTDSMLARTAVANSNLPDLATSPLHKQTSPRIASKLCMVSNDPLFAWYTDSPKLSDSSLINDITHSFSENSIAPSNFYTVTASVPCTESTSVLPCSSLGDHCPVKVELSIDAAALNRKLLIDLTDNDEDAETSYGFNGSQVSFQPTSSFILQKTSGNSTLKHTSPDYMDKRLSVNLQNSDNPSVSVNQGKDFFERVESHRNGTPSDCSQSQHPLGKTVNNSLPGQSILTNEKRCVSDCLARIYTDTSIETSNKGEVESTSDSFDVTSLNFLNSSPRKDPVRSSIQLVRESNNSLHPMGENNISSLQSLGEFISSSQQSMEESNRSFTSVQEDLCRFSAVSAIEPSASERTVVTQGKTLIKSSPFSLSSSLVKTNNMALDKLTKTVSTFEIYHSNTSHRKDTTHSVIVKKEHVETICIDEKEEHTPSNANTHLTSLSTLENSTRSTPRPCSSVSQQNPLESRSPLPSPSSSAGCGLTSVAKWTKDEVSAWLKNHQLDKICPNLIGLDGRGLQRMVLEHHHNYDNFYSRLRKTLGLSCFQTLMISRSMKELNDAETSENI